jgi:hypothetical protein
LFYSLTPQLRANLTVNTDFAQAEVDARQVNLTRFSLLFPEKRDFFLDGTLFFDFASGDGDGGDTDILPFFSRRIGLNEKGAPQRINFGSKMTGQAGGYDIGLMQVQTGKEEGVLGENFAVMRIKRRMLRESYVGGIYTHRSTRGGVGEDARQTMGVDFRLATSTFRGSDNLSASGYLLRTTKPLDLGKNAAFGAELSYPNDPLTADFAYTEVQEHYDAAVGFARRTGFRSFNPEVSFGPRPRQHPWIRRFNFGSELLWIVDSRDNRLLTREVDLNVFQVELHSQDSMQMSVEPTFERLEEDFEIAPGVTLPAGQTYNFTRYRLEANTTSRRPLALSPEVEWGSFYSGNLLQFGLTANLRAAPGQMFAFTTEWNRASLAESRFYTRLYRVVAETQFNPRIALVNNVQYDSQSAIIGWQSRFRLIVKPGNDLYFVYIHNWVDDPLSNRTYTLDRRLSTKLLYTHRF